MLAWCVMAVFILSSLVKGSPIIKLLERKARVSCDNFQLEGQDYTLLKYYMTGANYEFQFGAFTSPKLIDLPGENITRTNDRCSCRKTGRCVYRISYTLSARQYVNNATVYLLWPREADGRSDNFTLPKIRKLTESRNKSQQTKSFVVGLWITFILFIVSTGATFAW
ncbi:hypothetical protein ElyMa_002120200 [Elysia marginata]|uniref:Uncharacterized protein n=1 Tax=Elysia marginata TaxID=1093978 RepID=A0AAV4FIG7_9GAST|nr:hypothetical protein ElyMa_002120200 [Elysia marginata]